ncbi:hypothetical protein [Mesorhizobium sp. M7A.T.Ca.TU.009.02.1.1]|jgi:hypothetical protein|uniref:hypothetical protein n=1 Tax=Mesorhizobium sp. M7A.T.Ca.TU.009.02.1.1 TaxID=2496791 RepID=UPI0013DF84D9|nr:hypothetical protein [Mesorhizobium sp. M7A.T.Ca.TU.009.02.1.1]
MFEIDGRLGDNSSVRAHVSPTPMLGRLLAGWSGDGTFRDGLGTPSNAAKCKKSLDWSR